MEAKLLSSQEQFEFWKFAYEHVPDNAGPFRLSEMVFMVASGYTSTWRDPVQRKSFREKSQG